MGLEGLPDDDDDDPYGLFPTDLDKEIAAEVDPDLASENPSGAEFPQPRD